MNAIPDQYKTQAEISKLLADTAKTLEEVRKVTAETAKLQAESKWHPVVVAASLLGGGAALTGAIAAVLKLFAS
jgi:hypothetical protein